MFLTLPNSLVLIKIHHADEALATKNVVFHVFTKDYKSFSLLKLNVFSIGTFDLTARRYSLLQNYLNIYLP